MISFKEACNGKKKEKRGDIVADLALKNISSLAFSIADLKQECSRWGQNTRSLYMFKVWRLRKLWNKRIHQANSIFRRRCSSPCISLMLGFLWDIHKKFTSLNLMPCTPYVGGQLKLLTFEGMKSQWPRQLQRWITFCWLPVNSLHRL